MLPSVSEKKTGIARVFVVCLAGFIVGRLFFFPGFLDPLVPSHSDLYRYFSIGQQVWLSGAWLAPRPLMILVLHFLGVLHSPEMMWLILSLTSVVFAAALILLLQKFGDLKSNTASILLYSMIIFSLPSSFEIYQLDYGGMLAGVLSLAAIYIWLHYHSVDRAKALWLSSVVFWLSLEMKPTFAATILFLALLQFVFRRNRITFLLLVSVFGICAFVVLKDRFLGSPFLGAGSGADVYAIQIAPSKNLHALWVYIRAAVTRELLPGLAISYFLFWRAFKQSWLTVPILLALAVSSIMPMVIIPNRTLELYAWYCGMLLCIPFLYMLQPPVVRQSDLAVHPDRARKALISIGLLLTFGALSISSRIHAPQLYWYLNINNYNRNLIVSLEQLRELNADRDFYSSKGILIAGIRGPYNPFSSRPFIQYRTHLPDKYAVLLRKSEVAWNDSIHDMGTAVYSDQLDLGSFDYFIVYDHDGNIVRTLSFEEMKVIPEWRQIPTLACSLDPGMEVWTTSDLEHTVACLDEAGEAHATLELLDHVDPLEMSPMLHYYWGHAYESLGNYALARKEYKLALAAGDNDYFRAALERLRTK